MRVEKIGFGIGNMGVGNVNATIDGTALRYYLNMKQRAEAEEAARLENFIRGSKRVAEKLADGKKGNYTLNGEVYYPDIRGRYVDVEL